MTTHAWHADTELLEEYVAGSLDAISGASVEQHLVGCAECRAGITALVPAPPLDRAWSVVRDGVQSPPLPLVARLARRAGVSEPTAVLLAATASLRVAWLVSSFVAIAFATVAVLLGGDGMLAPFLLVAPLVPVVGVAASYGRRQDPLETLVLTAPYGRTRLILVRALAVLVCVLPFTTALGLLLPGPLWLAGAWLGPALALIPVLLALAAFLGPRLAIGVVTIAWCGVVLLSVRTLPPTWPVEAAQQLVYAAAAAVACLVLAARTLQDRKIGAVL